MKKRIVSMILALSMMLSILPVSAFADAGAGLSSAAAEETNSITYSSENEYEDVGTNSETKNQVVKIKIGTNGLPKAASGTGWSFDETTGLTITGTGSEDTEYILDGTVSCNVTVKNANSYTVYLLDGTVTGTLLIEADYMYGVYVLGGSYADVELNLGTIDGGTYDKLVQNDGYVWGGFFRDISGLKPDTQQKAHQLLLPENCTLNGQKETGDIYLIKQYSHFGKGNDLELAVESDTSCDAWAVVSTGGSAMALPAGTQNYPFTYFGSTIATVSISHDGKTLSASFNMIPAQDDAPMKLVPVVLGTTTELHFNSKGQPDLNGVTYVDSLDEDTDAKLHRVYMGNGWGYDCYPNDSSKESTVQILNQGGADFDFSARSDGSINCYVEITNANVTGGEFGKNGRLNITSGKISGGTFHSVSAGISSINGNSAVEITGGTFDSLYCNGSCSIANAVIQSCNFSTYGNNTYTISDTVLGELPDGLQKLLPAGQQLSTLVVRNGGVTAMNGRTLPLSTNIIYLVGAGSAELTLNTDVLSINDAPVSSYNANTSADGKVLRITGKNDGAEIFVNKSTDPSDLKPLRITEEGLPDLTGVTGVPVSGEGMTANLYEGLGWKYATMKENGRTRAALYITTPDGNPVDLASDTINPYHKAIAVEQITFANVTVTGIVAEGSVGAENTIIQDGTFQKDVYADDNSTIAGGTFQDVVRAYGTITGGAFNAVVQLNQNSEVTGGVFHDIQLPSYATEKTVIQNAMILGSLKTDGDSKAAVSNTVSCGYIESKYLAAGQQQSKLMMTDGIVERLNDYAAATDAVYLIGNVKAEIRFSNTVTNINGAEASNYNEGTSAIDRSLTITAKNDGEPIVVNMAATGKLPFSSLSKSDFDIDWSTLVPGITCKKDGVGKLSFVYVRTSDNKVFATYPPYDEYGVYKQRIVAQEGDKYTEGSLDIGEVVRKYTPSSADFAYDSKTQTATYNGKMYFDDAPLYSIQYVSEDGSFPSVTKPTKAGTYSVYIVVNDSDHYVGNQYEVGTYTVSESKYTLTVDDKSTEHVAGEKLSFTADEKDGYTFTGWKVTGLPTDVDTTKATISFTMPANNVTLKAQYTENAPKTYKLDVSDATVTLKDGGAVADLTAVPVGTELKATADEDTETSVFKNWSCTGLDLTEEQSTARVVYFTMPDHDVNLKAEFVTPTNKLDVSDATVTLKDGGAVADLTAVTVRAGRLLRRRRRRAVVPRGRHHAPLRRAQIAGSADPRLGGAEGSWQGVPGPAVGRGRRRAHRVGAHGLQGGLRAARGEARPAQRQAQCHCDAGRRLRAAAVVVGGSRRRGVGAGRPVRSAHRPPGAEAAHGGRRRRGARHVPQRGRPRRHGLHGVRIRARARGHPRRPLRPRVLRPGPVGLGDGGGVPFGQRPGQARRGEALPGGRGHGGERQGARVGPAARRPGRGDLPRAGGDVGTGGGVRAVRLRGVPAAQEPQGGGLPRPDLGRVLARAVPVAHIEQGQGVRRQGRPGVRHPRAQRPRPHGGVP